jgi:hypothetical protein
LQEPGNERRLAVVDVGDDGDVAKLHGDYGLLAEAALRPGRGRLLSSVAKVTGMRRRG